MAKIKRYRLVGSARTAPNKAKLTETLVSKLKPKGKQFLTWDDPAGKNGQDGLAVLVSPSGRKSYRCVYYFPGTGGKPHWKNIGRTDVTSLDEAREATRAARRQAKEGKDPKANDPSRSDSFKAVVEAYIQHEQIGNRGNLRAEETKKVILSHTGTWHARPIATIRPHEIEALLWRVRDGAGDKRGAPYMAKRLYAHLRDLFRWAARSSGPLASSPMAGMSKPWRGEQRRDREWFGGAAADKVIRKLWRAADQIGGAGGRYTKAMLLTGKRSGALVAMRWEEIDADGFWHPPASRAKNKQTYLTPLSPLALRVLGPRKDSGPVFEGVGDPTRLSGRVRTATGIDDFIWHGLRHLCETKTAELCDARGRAVIPANVRDLLFDHAPARGTGAVYDHHDYKAELRAACKAWAGYVERLVAAEGVTRLA